MYIKVSSGMYEREWKLKQEVLWCSVAHSLHFPGFFFFSQSIFFLFGLTCNYNAIYPLFFTQANSR